MKKQVWLRAAGAAALVLAAAALPHAQQPAQIDDAALSKAAAGENWLDLRPGPVRDALQPAHRHQRHQRQGTGTVVGLRCRPRRRRPGSHAARVRTASSTASPTGASCSPWTRAPARRSGAGIPWVNQEATRPEICCGVVNRGLALYKGMIYAPVIDGRLQALDAETGKVVWEARVALPAGPLHADDGAAHRQGQGDHRRQRRRSAHARLLRRLRRASPAGAPGASTPCRVIPRRASRTRR